MGKLQALQRLAEREAQKLGIEQPITLRWATAIPGCKRVAPSSGAHAHVTGALKGTICIKRGMATRDLVRHEVAHFAPGSGGHDLAFWRARAKQGSEEGKRRLIAAGKMRCPKHQWYSINRKSTVERVTAHGLEMTYLYTARCTRCGKVIG